MRPCMVRGINVGVAVVMSLAVVASPAGAIEAFLVELEAKYLKRDSKKQSDVDLVIAVEQARCAICHPGNDTRSFTPYGGKLAWRLSKHDKEKRKKIQDGLEEVGKLLSDPRNPKSPTYNELFRQGKLPPSPGH